MGYIVPVLILVLLIYFLLVGLFGSKIAKMSIPFLIIIFLFVLITAAFLIKFFWLIPILLLYLFIKKKSSNKTNSKTRYYRYESNKDFEDYYNYTRNSNSNNNSNANNTGDIKKKYYEVLNIGEGVTQEEVKKSYRELVKLHHPDRYMNSPESEKAYHEKKIKEINEAYEYVMKQYE